MSPMQPAGNDGVCRCRTWLMGCRACVQRQCACPDAHHENIQSHDTAVMRMYSQLTLPRCMQVNGLHLQIISRGAGDSCAKTLSAWVLSAHLAGMFGCSVTCFILLPNRCRQAQIRRGALHCKHYRRRLDHMHRCGTHDLCRAAALRRIPWHEDLMSGRNCGGVAAVVSCNHDKAAPQ
jgi:hypothetical protein